MKKNHMAYIPLSLQAGKYNSIFSRMLDCSQSNSQELINYSLIKI